MKDSGAVMSGASATKDNLKKERRKSKDLEEQLAGMAEASNAWNALEGRRSRRNSKNYEDTDLRTAFEAIDKDKSGTIEENELEQAIREMDPTLSSITVKEMMNFADSDGDGKCVERRAGGG